MSEKYQLLCECKAHTGLLEVNSSSVSHREQTRITISIRTALSWLFHAILILTSTTFFILSLRTQHKEQCPCSTVQRMFALLRWLLQEEIDMPEIVSILGEGWNTRTFARRFNGTFKLPSTYKGPPSEAVDNAWEKITPRKWPFYDDLMIKLHSNGR